VLSCNRNDDAESARLLLAVLGHDGIGSGRRPTAGRFPGRVVQQRSYADLRGIATRVVAVYFCPEGRPPPATLVDCHQFGSECWVYFSPRGGEVPGVRGREIPGAGEALTKLLQFDVAVL